MHLWTEYEGTTLAGYTLGRLHRSEGRNGFFLTTTPDGHPAIIRLTEAHFDETELVDRWQKIAVIAQPNLQAILRIGRTTVDTVPLAFCLLEPTDESLSDVLRDRVLSSDETKQVAEAVADALAALHVSGLVHEHIDATNVFAAGETIKLRSDCVRECTGDFEADTAEAREALRKSDVHDLGLLLLRCLTVDWQGTIPGPLPSPFDVIIPRLLDGSLTADGLVSTLRPPPMAALVREIPAPMEEQAPPAVVYAGMPKPVIPQAVEIPMKRSAMRSFGEDMLHRVRPMNARPIPRKTWIASGAAAAMLGLILWNTAREPKHAPADPPVAVAAAEIPRPQARTAQPPVSSRQDSLLNSGMQAGWHVIAYTYNYEQQAQAKAEQLKHRYVAMQPHVFTPTGHAPYFVALGGPSDAVSAMALRNRARQVGLPRDTYARNF